MFAKQTKPLVLMQSQQDVHKSTERGDADRRIGGTQEVRRHSQGSTGNKLAQPLTNDFSGNENTQTKRNCARGMNMASLLQKFSL